MTDRDAQTPSSSLARTAGILFLLTFVLPTISWLFISSRFVVAGDAAAAAARILSGEFLFRVGIIADLVRAALALAFGLVLYILLKPAGRQLALFALLLKLTEAALVAVLTLGQYIVLLMLTGRDSAAAFGPEQSQALAGSFVNVTFEANALVMLFHAANLMLFLYLLFRSAFVPRLLAGFGVFAYALVFLYGLLAVLAPPCAAAMAVQVVCLAPSVFLELSLGTWLLAKGTHTAAERRRP